MQNFIESACFIPSELLSIRRLVMAKRGINIYHRADGRWEGRCYVKGSKEYKSIYGKSYSEAKQKLEKLRSEVLVPSTRCSLLVVDILKMWIESRRTEIKESSYAGYRHKLEKHLMPYFSIMKYNRLERSVVNSFISAKRSEGLSSKYISDMVIMMKAAARWAENTYNYANLIKNVELPKKRRSETAVFTPAEQKKIIYTINIEHSNSGCGVLLSLFTGLRIGEVCALKWSDIDFQNKMLHVTKTIQRICIFGTESKSTVKITSPKSETSVRDIPLPDFLINILRTYRSNDNEYILSGSEKPIEPRCFSNRYKALLKKAEVPSHKFHSLRHTFAVNALHQNFDIKTLSELLGHSSANITLSVYLHSSMERKSICMNRLQALV